MSQMTLATIKEEPRFSKATKKDLYTIDEVSTESTEEISQDEITSED
jgi:hypothetical protein